MTQVLLLKEEINANSFVKPEGNRGNNKPKHGGLWSSSLDDDNKSAWINFAHYQEFYSNIEEMKMFHVTVSKDARILYIYNTEHYQAILEEYGTPVIKDIHPLASISSFRHVLDYDKIAEDYDAVSLTEMGLNENWNEFYGWDCESTLWLNLNCFEKIEEVEFSLS